MTAALDRLVRGAEPILGRPLTATETDRFTRYLDLLLAWQRVSRLVGSADPIWIVDRLMLDSLLFLHLLPPAPLDVLDFGSGAGFPGLPLKIVTEGFRMTLLEARRRRASFLSTAVRELGLRNVSVLNERADAAAVTLGHRFDAVVMRCAGAADTVFPAAAPFLRAGGLIVATAPIVGKGSITQTVRVGRMMRQFLVVRATS